MSKENLSNIIGSGESITIEWKPSLSQINEIIETISAFSNTEGGKLIIGVSKSGKLLGVDIGKDTIERLTNQISQNTDPKIHPRITVKKIDKKSIIIINEWVNPQGRGRLNVPYHFRSLSKNRNN